MFVDREQLAQTNKPFPSQGEFHDYARHGQAYFREKSTDSHRQGRI